MNDNKGQTIFLSVIGIATLLVAIVGATFAWFSATVTEQNGASNSVIVQTAKLGTVTFNHGNTINTNNIYPGWSETKDVSITADATATVEIPYVITLHVLTNDFSTYGSTEGYVKYSISSTSTGGTVQEAKSNIDIEDTSDVVVARGTLPASNGGTATTHSYTITFAFPEMSINQNSQQAKTFNGYLEATTSNYTWNSTQPGNYSEYPY